MAKVDGSEPVICKECGQTSEEFYYFLKHPRRCVQKLEEDRKALILERERLRTAVDAALVHLAGSRAMGEGDLVLLLKASLLSQ